MSPFFTVFFSGERPLGGIVRHYLGGIVALEPGVLKTPIANIGLTPFTFYKIVKEFIWLFSQVWQLEGAQFIWPITFII